MTFSVIIPTYNRAKMLKRAIQSVVNQTYKNWELIIIDDGSIDNTREIVEYFREFDQRIYYYYQQNQERSSARNNGISISRGELICFLDSDDEYDSCFLEHIYNQYKLKQFDLAISTQKIIDTTFPATLVSPPKLPLDINYFFKSAIVPGRICVRREFLGDVRFKTHIRISEDTYFLCELGIKQPVIVGVERAILIYHAHDGNSVNYKSSNVYFKRLQTLKEIAKSPVGIALNPKLVKQVLNDCYFGIFKHYYFNNRTFNSRLTMLRALYMLPSHRFKEKLYLLTFAHKKNLFRND